MALEHQQKNARRMFRKAPYERTVLVTGVLSYFLELEECLILPVMGLHVAPEPGDSVGEV
jgi:hypothetical protein